MTSPAPDLDWMLGRLDELVAAPTELGNEEPGQLIVERALEQLGLEPRSIPLDAAALREHPNASPFSWDLEGKRNVTATWSGVDPQRARSLILCGHIDVVPPAAAALWTSPPYEPRREGDWVYGRGAGDMKAGLVAMLGAVKALRDAEVQLNGDVHLASVVEEECTGNGALQCLIDGLHADACVITEPHPDHLTIAQVGVLWFHVEIAGRPAHAAYADTGANAIDASHHVLWHLRKLEAELNDSPPPPYDTLAHPIHLNPGVIAGGDWGSTVAAQTTLTCRLAMFPGTDPRELQDRVEEAVARAAQADDFLRANPPRVRYDGFVCEGSTVATDEPIVTALSAAYAQVHGNPPALRPTTATTDARHFIRSGIPTVCFGPRAENYHGIDERVSVSSIAQTAQVLTSFIEQWCNNQEEEKGWKPRSVPAGTSANAG